MKTIFESTGLQYERQGDYMLPKLKSRIRTSVILVYGGSAIAAI